MMTMPSGRGINARHVALRQRDPLSDLYFLYFLLFSSGVYEAQLIARGKGQVSSCRQMTAGRWSHAHAAFEGAREMKRIGKA